MKLEFLFIIFLAFYTVGLQAEEVKGDSENGAKESCEEKTRLYIAQVKDRYTVSPCPTFENMSVNCGRVLHSVTTRCEKSVVEPLPKSDIEKPEGLLND